jgi:hypothetical protein
MRRRRGALHRRLIHGQVTEVAKQTILYVDWLAARRGKSCQGDDDRSSLLNREEGWLNGTFGAGKTATATELLPGLGARLSDPETVGYMLRPNLTGDPQREAWLRQLR